MLIQGINAKINPLRYLSSYFKSLTKFLIFPHRWKSNISQINLKFSLTKVSFLPRYTSHKIIFFGKRFEIADSASFIWDSTEIFDTKIYNFVADNSQPLIIDCGANIGLSILYFKQIYPDCKIIAFEPDNKIYSMLSNNVNNFDLSDVQLINKAVWNSETSLEFISEGSNAGTLLERQPILPIKTQSQIQKYPISTVRLRDYLQQTVDFLKIDIEGAENTVIADCADLLSNVKNIFVEYHSFIDRPQSIDNLISTLINAGFRLYIQTISQNMQPLYYRNICNGIDMQLNIFGFRESAKQDI